MHFDPNNPNPSPTDQNQTPGGSNFTNFNPDPLGGTAGFDPNVPQTTSFGATATDNNYTTPKKTNPFIVLFRSLAIVLIMSLLAFTGVFVYILTNPSSSFSTWAVDNTPLGDYVDLPGRETVDTSSSSSEKPVNTFIGGNDRDGSEFEFAPEADALPVTDVVESVLPSVLSLSLSVPGANGISDEVSAGTGYIVTSDGLVVTNKHVVAVLCGGGTSNIQITGLSQTEVAYDLELLSIDAVDDVAILQVQNAEAPFIPVELANSDDLRLGQDIIAIGNVLGELQNTVTRGIISGLDRSFETDLVDPCTENSFQADSLIQIDAAINRGNSGGPLFNASGQLVGMNTLGTTDSENIGLAIPSVVIQTILEGFTDTNGQIQRARLGVSSLPINSVRKAQNPWIPTTSGEIVFSRQGNAVSANSAAATAGIKTGDIILSVDRQDLVATSANPSPLRRAILLQQPGNTVEVSVLQATGSNAQGFEYANEPVTLEVTLGSISFNLETNEVKVS
jgi:serine protease Do